MQIEFHSLGDSIKVFWKYKQILAVVSPSTKIWDIVSFSGMQVTCWELCLTQPHLKSFCMLSVWYLCKFCLGKDCRIELSAFQRNAFDFCMKVMWQQFFLHSDLWSHCALMSSVICKEDSWERISSEGWETNCGCLSRPLCSCSSKCDCCSWDRNRTSVWVF